MQIVVFRVVPNWVRNVAWKMTYFCPHGRVSQPCATHGQVSEVEIAKAIWSFKLIKAPRLDGLHPFFYQCCWQTVRHKMIKLVLEVFQTSSILDRLNETLIAIIPKSRDVASISQFRPISLCNTSYKIIKKILVMCLRPMLNKIVSPFQGSFLPKR
ncbi:reverse transcriptase [Gossypium australe]|uniref:Reverse transcriptase n=1 Tax=Gossypium australe TaxID=47621 RepID=A0A5B6WP45_9ROSI|nr:reverse transcriptase [Gossypium australe]